MKLSNEKIVILANNGILNITEHDVPAKDAYKSYKFRKALEKAVKEIAEKEKELPKTAGVEDGKKPTKEQTKKIEELRKALFADETDLGDIKAMSFESYHILANENRRTAIQVPDPENDGKYITRFIDVCRACEGILEGVLFKLDDEDTKKAE